MFGERIISLITSIMERERERERERCKWLTNETVSVCLATPGSSHFGVDWEDLSLWSHWPISGPRWVWAGANITAQGWTALCSVILLVLSGSRLWYNWYYHSQAMTPHKIHIREGLDISSFYWGWTVSEPCLGTDYYNHDWRVRKAGPARLTRMTGQSCSNVFSFKGFQPDNNRYGSLESLYS